MRRWREVAVTVILFAVLIGFTVYISRNETGSGGPVGSVHSSADGGASGLQRWLEALGYTTRAIQYTEWHLPDDADVLFMLAPDTEPVSEDEAAETLRWVRKGGTLILATPYPSLSFQPNRLLDHLQAKVVQPSGSEPVQNAVVVQPLLVNPPVGGVSMQTAVTLQLDRDDYLPLLRTPLGDTLVGIQEGQGYVYVTTGVHQFTNAGLRDENSAALVLNLIGRAPEGATILFDEYHHGFRTPPSLQRMLQQQWWGRAIIYTLLLTAAYIVLSGRRFGRPVPLPQDVARRSSAEYVQSLAQIFRRAGKRDYILDHYRIQLKRRLARPYGFVPPQDDDEFVRELQRFGGATAEQAVRLRALLGQLRRTLSEEELIGIVSSVDSFTDDKGRVR